MENRLADINWMEKSGELDRLLQAAKVTIMPLNGGLEADAMQLILNDEQVVMKTWNKQSRPDVAKQYRLLKHLHRHGVPVSKPLGWGMDSEGHAALLTSFDGTPLAKLNKAAIVRLAHMISAVHQFPVEQLENGLLERYDFVDYFYPGIRQHPDLHSLLQELVAAGRIKQERLIHGDVNLGNVLELQGKLTIVDWTNGQLGDPRFDMAWAIALLHIYVGPRYGTMLRAACLAQSGYTADELELFEAIACIRWLLLHRLAYVPSSKGILSKVTSYIESNAHLREYAGPPLLQGTAKG